MMRHIIGLVLISFILGSCSPIIWHKADAKYQRYSIGEDLAANKEMTDIVSPYKNQLDATMDEVIGQLDVELLKERVESNMGNWYTDIILEEAKRVSAKKVDFAMQNYGGLRSGSIASGPITVRTIYELMPFENTLVTVDLSGDKVQTFFDDLAEYGGAPISSGVKFQISGGKAINVSINGEPIDYSASYRIALNDYTAEGGDDASVFAGCEIHEYNILQRDAIINHIKRDTENGIIQTASKEGRITKID